MLLFMNLIVYQLVYLLLAIQTAISILIEFARFSVIVFYLLLNHFSVLLLCGEQGRGFGK